jgi:hypothetical protein
LPIYSFLSSKRATERSSSTPRLLWAALAKIWVW